MLFVGAGASFANNGQLLAIRLLRAQPLDYQNVIVGNAVVENDPAVDFKVVGRLR